MTKKQETAISKTETGAIAQPQENMAMTPMQVVTAVVQQGFDAEALERATAWAERMQENADKRAFAQALVAFKSACPTVAQKSKGHTNKYAKLVDLDEQIRPLMQQCQLACTWRILENEKDWIVVECRVTHGPSGYSDSTSFGGPPDRGPGRNELQARASTVSYLERYTLKSLLGIVDKDMEDNDGANGASSPPPPQPRSRQILDTDDDVVAAKRRFRDVCLEKMGKQSVGKTTLLRILAQVQQTVGTDDIAACAEWLSEHGRITDGIVNWEDDPGRAGTNTGADGATDATEGGPAPAGDDYLPEDEIPEWDGPT